MSKRATVLRKAVPGFLRPGSDRPGLRVPRDPVPQSAQLNHPSGHRAKALARFRKNVRSPSTRPAAMPFRSSGPMKSWSITSVNIGIRRLSSSTKLPRLRNPARIINWLNACARKGAPSRFRMSSSCTWNDNPPASTLARHRAWPPRPHTKPTAAELVHAFAQSPLSNSACGRRSAYRSCSVTPRGTACRRSLGPTNRLAGQKSQPPHA